VRDPTHLIWIDLEMTGLDTNDDLIIEIATIVTDRELNEVAIGPVYAIGQTEQRLEAMDDWNRTQHQSSGLWQRVLESNVSVAEAEEGTVAFLKEHLPPATSPMCGNSICQDRRFMARLMPGLEHYFHYRNLDVSTVKELARRWAPRLLEGFNKDSTHLALGDIRDSIEELAYYRQFMGQLAGQTGQPDC